MIGLVTYCI